jgi:DNA-binding transcriptional MerR regulator
MLRAWDEAALFRPAWVDPDTRYRYYLPSQLPALRRMLALRDLGLGLDDIRRIGVDGEDLRDALRRRRAELEQERREIDRRLRTLDIELTDDERPDVVLRTLPAETIATFDLRLALGGDVGAAFYELETFVRDRGLRAHRPPGSIPAERCIWVPLRRPMAATDRIGVRRLPAVRAATILHRGDYDTMPATQRRLDGWLAASGQQPSRPLRVLYLQFGAEPELALPRAWVVDRVTDFVTELQQPIASEG